MMPFNGVHALSVTRAACASSVVVTPPMRSTAARAPLLEASTPLIAAPAPLLVTAAPAPLPAMGWPGCTSLCSLSHIGREILGRTRMLDLSDVPDQPMGVKTISFTHAQCWLYTNMMSDA